MEHWVGCRRLRSDIAPSEGWLRLFDRRRRPVCFTVEDQRLDEPSSATAAITASTHTIASSLGSSDVAVLADAATYTRCITSSSLRPIVKSHVLAMWRCSNCCPEGVALTTGGAQSPAPVAEQPPLASAPDLATHRFRHRIREFWPFRPDALRFVPHLAWLLSMVFRVYPFNLV